MAKTFMAKTFGFTHDELKLLLVAVRQMRRTFEQVRKAGADADAPIDDYAELYDDLFEKLLDMVGPVPEHVEDVL